MSHAKGAYTWGWMAISLLTGLWVIEYLYQVCFDKVDVAVIDTIKNGTNYTRPGILEYETADYLINEHFEDKFDMIKFGKNGSDVTTANY